MTAIFSLLAQRLFPIRLAFSLSALAFALGLIYLFVFAEVSHQKLWSTPCLLGLLWSLLLFTLVHGFLPSATKNEPGLWGRLKQKVMSFFIAVFTLLFAGLVAASAYVTYKLLIV